MAAERTSPEITLLTKRTRSRIVCARILSQSVNASSQFKVEPRAPTPAGTILDYGF